MPYCDLRTRDLAYYNTERLLPGFDGPDFPQEIDYTARFLAHVDHLVPSDPDMDWFVELNNSGPGQNDPLFEYLATAASKEEMAWFLKQEAAGEAGFGDLVAMTQVKLPVLTAKLEMASNYWDEMGNGRVGNVHDELLHRVTAHFDIQPSIASTTEPPLLLANIMTAFAVHRRFAYQSVGALGVIEMTAPSRVAKVSEGLERLGVPKKFRRYFALHATLDIKHSRQWNENVMGPLASLGHMRPMAQGAIARLTAGQYCFERYREELGI